MIDIGAAIMYIKALIPKLQWLKDPKWIAVVKAAKLFLKSK